LKTTQRSTGPRSLYIFSYNKQVPGYEKGNFIGPTILSGVTPDMECYKVFSDIKANDPYST